MSRKELAETIGLIAIVITLVFVALELRQTQDIGLAEGYAATFATRLEAGNSIKEHADLWGRGAAGEELNETEAAVFAILVNQLNEAAIQAFLYKEQVSGIDDAQIDAQDFSGFLYQNPGVRAVWNKREDNLAKVRGLLREETTYSHIWTDSVRNYLAELDRQQPQLDKEAFVDW